MSTSDAIQQQQQKQKRRQDDKAFILDFTKWPNWPALPLKRPRKTGLPDIGFIWADRASDKTGVHVYLENIFRLHDMTVEERRAIKTEEYPTVDALLDAGWIVD